MVFRREIMKQGGCIIFSGGVKGTEAEFGALAQLCCRDQQQGLPRGAPASGAEALRRLLPKRGER